MKKNNQQMYWEAMVMSVLEVKMGTKKFLR